MADHHFQDDNYKSFKATLRESASAEEFLTAFREMMRALRAGMHVPDAEVGEIVTIARSKRFAEQVLPEVYGWAGSMFGNGRMEDAIIYFLESAEGYRKVNKHYAEALSYFEIALVHHRTENFEEAEEYYHKALDTASDSLDTRTMINCINGLALIRRHASDYLAAERQFRQALRIAEDHNDVAWIGILNGNIGSVHLRQEQWDSSLLYYKKNLSFVRNTQELENEIETYGHLGETMNGMKRYKTALMYLDSAMKVIETEKVQFSDFFNPLIYLHESYSKAYAGIGNYQCAYDHLEEFHKMSNERLLKNKGRSIKQLQLSYSFRQKQQEVDLLSEVNSINTKVIRQERFKQLAFIAVIVLLCVIIFIAIRTNQNKHRMNRVLTESNEELARLNNVKDKLFSVISHDLRGPLGNLQHLLSMISTGTLDQQQFSTISGRLGQQIKASGNALENLLFWAKAQLNETETARDTIALHTVVAQVLNDFKVSLDEKAVRAENLLTTDLLATVDRAQLEIVVRNIVGNAIKFSKPGGLIRVFGSRKSDQVAFSVEDHGIGMTEEQVSYFREGKHFTSPGTKMEKGTGIGLIIIREMIKQNHGKLDLESSPNKGTVITITLPAAEISRL
jgi:two-component system sensor histidine kinase/response regulator